MDTASSLPNFPTPCALRGLEVAATSFIEILRSQVPHVAHVAWMNQLSTHIGSRGPWACRRHEAVLWTTCLLSRSAHRQRGRGAVINGPKSPRSFAVTSQWNMTPWTFGQILVDMNLKFLQLWKLCILVLSKEWSNESKFTVKSRVLSPINELPSFLTSPTANIFQISSQQIPCELHHFRNFQVGDRCWIFNLGPAVLQKRGYAAAWKHDMGSTPKKHSPEITDHLIWDLTRPGPPKGGLVREISLFQGNLGWWNIIIWPDLMPP